MDVPTIKSIVSLDEMDVPTIKSIVSLDDTPPRTAQAVVQKARLLAATEVVDIDLESEKSSPLACEIAVHAEVIDVEEESLKFPIYCGTAVSTEVIDVEEDIQRFPTFGIFQRSVVSGTAVHAEDTDVHGTQDFRNVDKCQILALPRPLGATAILSSNDMDTACTSTPCENISLTPCSSIPCGSQGTCSKENTPLCEEGADSSSCEVFSVCLQDSSLRDHDSESASSNGNSFIVVAEELDIGLQLEVNDSDDDLPLNPPSSVAATRFLRASTLLAGMGGGGGGIHLSSPPPLRPFGKAWCRRGGTASIIGHVQPKQTPAWDFPLTEKEKCEHLINSMRDQIQELTFNERRLGIKGELMRQDKKFVESLRHCEDAPMESLRHVEEDKTRNVQCSWPSMPCGIEGEPIMSPEACSIVRENCEPYDNVANCVYNYDYDHELPYGKLRL